MVIEILIGDWAELQPNKSQNCILLFLTATPDHIEQLIVRWLDRNSLSYCVVIGQNYNYNLEELPNGNLPTLYLLLL